VMPHIAADNALDKPRIDLISCAALFHHFHPVDRDLLYLSTGFF
jgi:hypothetical protein